jgi:hypothetical protein
VDTAGGPQNDADGVLVVSAWMQGAAGQMLARITMSGKDSSSPVVRVVTSPNDLHEAIDEWLAALQK